MFAFLNIWFVIMSMLQGAATDNNCVELNISRDIHQQEEGVKYQE